MKYPKNKYVERWSGRNSDTEESFRDSLIESCSRRGYFGQYLRSCFALSCKTEGCMTVKTQRESLTIGLSHRERSHEQEDDALTPRQSIVSFGTVEFRSYPIMLGDNPSASSGPPLTICWQHDPEETLTSDIDTYETCMPARRTKTELRVPPSMREDLLLLTGMYSRHELTSAVKLVKKERDRRIKTAMRNERIDSISTKIESVRSTFRSMNCLRNSVSVSPRTKVRRDTIDSMELCPMASLSAAI